MVRDVLYKLLCSVQNKLYNRKRRFNLHIKLNKKLIVIIMASWVSNRSCNNLLRIRIKLKFGFITSIAHCSCRIFSAIWKKQPRSETHFTSLLNIIHNTFFNFTDNIFLADNSWNPKQLSPIGLEIVITDQPKELLFLVSIRKQLG